MQDALQELANPFEGLWLAPSDVFAMFVLIYLGIAILQALLCFVANCIAWKARK